LKRRFRIWGGDVTGGGGVSKQRNIRRPAPSTRAVPSRGRVRRIEGDTVGTAVKGEGQAEMASDACLIFDVMKAVIHIARQ
jgi:hypothetical protein